MSYNFSPNVEKILIDKSATTAPTLEGSVGFVMSADWGPVNKIQGVNDETELVSKYGYPVLNKNNRDWYQISEYLRYSSGAKIVRVAVDDRTTINASLVVNTNCETMNFATDLQTITVADASAFSVGDPITTNGTGLGIGKVLHKAGNVLSVQVTSGYFTAGDNVDDASPYSASETTIAVAAVAGVVNASNALENPRRLNIDDSEPTIAFPLLTQLTVASVTAFTVDGEISNTGTAAVGVVRAIDTTEKKLYVQMINGTFAPADAIDNTIPFPLGGGATTIDALGVTANFDEILCIYARYPGTEGNNLKVAICDKTDFDEDGLYDGTNKFSSLTDLSLVTDELFIVVSDEDDNILETHIVSTDEDATYSGGFSKFIDDYLYNNSAYIYSKSITSGTKTIADFDGFFGLTALTEGASTQCAYATVIGGYDIIFNDELNGIEKVCDCVDYSNYAANHATLMAYIQTLAEVTQRHFCIMTLPVAAINVSAFDIANVQTYTAGLTSKFVAVYDNWKKVFDRYNKQYFYIPCTGDMAGLHVVTHERYNKWEAPFGNEKGIIRNCTELYHNLPRGGGSIVSQLYKEGVNSIFYKNGIGFIAWGNKTSYNPASDFSSINVTYLAIDITERLLVILDNFISKPINLALYTSITNTIGQILKNDYAGKGAFNDTDGDDGYLFICNTTNNTASDVSAKRVVCDLFVKPVRSVEFIKLNFIVTPAGTSFEEMSS